MGGISKGVSAVTPIALQPHQKPTAPSSLANLSLYEILLWAKKKKNDPTRLKPFAHRSHRSLLSVSVPTFTLT